jgi:protease II
VHGRRFDDPYDWLERLDDVETRAWVAAQEAVTHGVLRDVRGRDWLREAVARSSRYARLSPPIPAGQHGREFLWQADADDDKLKLMMRPDRAGQLETVLDPNTWARDEVLVFAVPSPDGTLVAFGKAVGGRPRRQNKGWYDGQAVRARSAKAAASTGSGLILRSNLSTWSRTPCRPSCSPIRARVTG